MTAGSSSPSLRGVSGPGSSKSTAARSRLAEPERHRWRLAFGVRHPHHAVADAQNAPGRVTQLEHVARQRLDGEVLVQRADDMTFGLEQHAVIEDFGNRPT